jgi:hypothetical protein
MFKLINHCTDKNIHFVILMYNTETDAAISRTKHLYLSIMRNKKFMFIRMAFNGNRNSPLNQYGLLIII